MDDSDARRQVVRLEIAPDVIGKATEMELWTRMVLLFALKAGGGKVKCILFEHQSTHHIVTIIATTLLCSPLDASSRPGVTKFIQFALD